MNPRRLGWFLATAVLIVLVTIAAPVSAQESQAAGEQAEQSMEAVPTAPAPALDAVESILRKQEQLLMGKRFSYDPERRRDPFRSLYETVKPQKGPRPRGVAGMLVTELNLSGIVKDSGKGDVALVIGSDNKGYFLRPGDEVYDATVISVDSRKGVVTFRQQVDDPRKIKPYRDVVKRLVPVNEESADE